ncbi:MAG: IS200/IS605 family transposase [Anaerolineae bacterium]
MGSPYTELYVHLIWTTWQRTALLAPEVEPALFSAFAASCAECKCHLIAAGAAHDHVHLLVRLHPTTAISHLVQRIKGSSSHLMNHRLLLNGGFRWQGAYRALTVSKRSLTAIADYCLNQRAHHAANAIHVSYEPGNEANDGEVSQG